MWINNLWIILTVFVQLVLCIENGAVPFIQPFSFPSNVIKGQSVTITCAVTAGTGPFTFKWAKNGTPLSDQPLTRIQTHEEYSLLSLKSVDISRTGNYTCFVMNANGSSNHTVELVVFEPPSWSILPDDAEAVFSSDLRIDCSATGVPQPKITWKKVQSTEFHPNVNGGRHKVMSNGSLHLMNVHMDDGGEYECIASNGIGDGIRKSVSVLIHVPPQFEETYQLLKVRSSHSTVLRCDVTGDAPIDVKWSKEYMDDKDNRYKIQDTPLPNGLLSELYISRVLRQDAGVYVCSATNAYGKQEKTIKLVVLEPPASPSDIVVRQVEKNEATIQWMTPYSGNSPITRFVVQYWRDTGAPPKLLEETVSSEKTSYVMRGLRPGTSYVVRLIAENEFGSSTPSVPLRFYTAEDTPSGYPTDLSIFSRGLHELTLRWKAPAPEQRNGAIQGYELGYREHYSLEPYVYREAPLGPGITQEFVLNHLKENTEYEIVVRAYNRAGKGPPSVPVIAKTRDKGNLVAPVLWVESTTANSITVRWSGNDDHKNSDLSHTLHYRKESGKWQERLISNPQADSFILSGLEENSLYFLYIQAMNANEQSSPSVTVSARTMDPSFERSSMTQIHDTASNNTLVISLSVAVSCVIIVCVVAVACVYITKVNSGQAGKRAGHMGGDFVEQPSTSRSTPLSRHTSNFRYVDVNARPLLWCSTPAPPNDYPSPYATLPLRPTPISKRWQSEDGMSPPASERSESLINQRVEVPEEKLSNS